MLLHYIRSTLPRINMNSTGLAWLRQTALGLALAFAAAGAARAGAVSLNFDPPFGPALPNVQYEGAFSFTVPDACVDQARQFQQLAKADRGSADLHNGLDRRAG